MILQRLCTPEMRTRDFLLCSWQHPEEFFCYTQGSHSQMHFWSNETLLHFLNAFAFYNHGLTETQEAPSEHKEILFCCEGEKALEQISRRNWGGFQGYPKAIWTWSWATMSKWLCLSRGVGSDDLQRSLPTSTILWCCESKKLSSGKTCCEVVSIIDES